MLGVRGVVDDADDVFEELVVVDEFDVPLVLDVVDELEVLGLPAVPDVPVMVVEGFTAGAGFELVILVPSFVLINEVFDVLIFL